MYCASKAIHVAVFALGFMLLAGSAPVEAQMYKYRDPQSGRMILTDKPPAGARRVAPELQEEEPEEAVGKEGAKASGIDPRLAALKKEEEAKLLAEEVAKQAENKKRLDEACAGLRGNLAALKSGQRLSRYDASGERSFMTDDERARELEKTQREMEVCE